MAHFAQLNPSNLVTQVVVVNNTDIIDPATGLESEQVGIDLLHGLFGPGTVWVQTSYNGRMRGRYAGIGYLYDPVLDAFIAPQPYPSWTLDDATTEWQPPVPMPATPGIWMWDEDTQTWVNAA